MWAWQVGRVAAPTLQNSDGFGAKVRPGSRVDLRYSRAKFKLSQHRMGNRCTFSNECDDGIRTVSQEREG